MNKQPKVQVRGDEGDHVEKIFSCDKRMLFLNREVISNLEVMIDVLLKCSCQTHPNTLVQLIPFAV